MKMAKASKEDIQTLIHFFSQWEALKEDDWLVDDWDEEMLEKLPVKPNKDNEVEQIEFFRVWLGKVETDWRRVVWGCEILIDNCADPDKSYLDLHPDLKNANVLCIGGEFETEDGAVYKCVGVEPCEDEEGEIDVSFSRVYNEEE